MASLPHQSQFHHPNRHTPSRSHSYSHPRSSLVSVPTSPQSTPRSSFGLAPSALVHDNSNPSPPVPLKGRQRSQTYSTSRKDLGIDPTKLNQHLISAISSSSSSSDSVDDGTDTPLTSSELPSPEHLAAPDSISPISPTSPLTQQLNNDLLPYSSFLSCASSPTSTITPTSPLKVAFSSPKNHRFDSTAETATFSSYFNQLSPNSKQLYIKRLEDDEHEGQQQQQEKYSTVDLKFDSIESKSDSPIRIGSQAQPTIPNLSPGSPRSLTSQQRQNVSPHQNHSRPPYPRRIKTSMGAMSQISIEQHNSMTLHQISRSNSLRQQSVSDPKIDTTSVIPIHVRYVPKDLWVQVDLPRDIPVHKARDLILSKCRLTCMPPQAPSIPAAFSEHSERITACASPEKEAPPIQRRRNVGLNNQVSPRSSAAFESSNLLAPTHCIDGRSTPASSLRSLQPNRNSTLEDDESFNDQESDDDDEAELRAEALMVDSMFPQSPSIRSSLQSSIFSDSEFLGLHGTHSPRLSQQEQSLQREMHRSSQGSVSTCSTGSGNQNYYDQLQYAPLTQQQLKKLISYNSGLGIAGDRGSKDSCSSRLNNIPGWSAFRSRQSSGNARQMVREVLDHGGKLADCLAYEEEESFCETRKEECTAWKACFGLFWLAAGHWLDDSRLVSSYHFQPHCLLELQLRNNYIQLPPQGTGLNYYDHYAEGVLYKKSKKSRQVSKLTSQGIKDSAGFWKARWVVLQGNKLFIYHKQKDTTKKSIDLLPPLTVTTTVIPHNPRQSFKSVSSTMSMSTTMISLTLSQDPNAPEVCFRATSETELNNWVRVFNSLNFAPLCGVPPPLFPNSLMNSPIIKPCQVPPPLPPLPLDLPPASMTTPPPIPMRRRERHQSYTAATGNGYFEVAGFRRGDGPAYPTERKRCHTTQGVLSPSQLPSINPVLISNAAAALSNLNQGSEMGSGNDSNECSNVSGVFKMSRSVSMRVSGQMTPKRDRLRTMSHTSTSTLVGSLLNGGLSQSPYHSLSRNGSASSRHRYQYQGIGLQDDGHGLQQRQRTITEPDLAQKIRVRSMSSQHGSQQTLLRDYLQRSKDNLSDIASIPNTPPPEIKEFHMPSEPECQALLNSSNKRSSASPLYSGYIWMYIPNTQQPSSTCLKSLTPPSSKNGSSTPSMSTIPMSKSSSNSSLALSSTAAGSKASNICITKASGRYVKCFVVINSLGQFQWVEVNTELGQDSEIDPEEQKEQTANVSYGILLNPNPTAIQAKPEVNTVHSRKNSLSEMPILTGPAKGQVQVAMAHKLRLYFFCIKISISSLSEVIIEMVDTPENEEKMLSRNSSFNSPRSSTQSGYTTPIPQSPPPSLTKKSPLRAKNRLSAPSAHQRAASALSSTNLPTRSVSLHKTRTRNRASTQSSSSLGNNGTAMWPSMSRLHERVVSTPIQQTSVAQVPDPERMISKTFSILPTSKKLATEVEFAAGASLEDTEQISKKLLVKTQSLFMENRTRSAPPGSITSRKSTSSNRDSLQNDSAAAVISRHESLMHVLGRTTGTLYPSEEDASNAASEVRIGDTSEEHSKTGQGSKSHVLLLVQDLQKALGRCRTLPDNLPGEVLEQENRPTLYEITTKKRASLQQQKDSANVEATRLKLIGGTLESLAETNEMAVDTLTLAGGDHAVETEEQKERERVKEQERALRQAVGKIMMQCPFLEKSETCVDVDGRRFVTLKGYTETEEAWRILQSSLDQFLDGPIKDQRSALPPEDTLIPSYHAPRLPEIRLSEKAQNFLKAKDRATTTATAAGLLNNDQAPMDINTAPNTAATTSIDVATMATTSTVTAIGTGVSTTAASAIARACLSRTNTTGSSNASTIVAARSDSTDIRTRRSATLAMFNRHSVPLAHGVGYGPRKSFVESIENCNVNKKAERSSLPSRLPVAMSLRRNMVDTTTRGPRVRTESESGARPISSAAAAAEKHGHSRTSSGNMFMKYPSSTSPSEHQLQKQHGSGRAVAHLKARGASLTRWMHLSGANHSNSVSNSSSISCLF
ncbi:hypothetical protein BGX26_005963 [Mortierella sp. AD094]|nr:hypothetical protein BGX26_005963 [Mortierella sp. AD094]